MFFSLPIVKRQGGGYCSLAMFGQFASASVFCGKAESGKAIAWVKMMFFTCVWRVVLLSVQRSILWKCLELIRCFKDYLLLKICGFHCWFFCPASPFGLCFYCWHYRFFLLLPAQDDLITLVLLLCFFPSCPPLFFSSAHDTLQFPAQQERNIEGLIKRI